MKTTFLHHARSGRATRQRDVKVTVAQVDTRPLPGAFSLVSAVAFADAPRCKSFRGLTIQHHMTKSPDASDALYAAAYEQLKRLARRQLRAGRGDITINTTELVHEAFLKLGSDHTESWDSRAHFFGAAARAMREVLVDFARRRAALKRGGGWRAVSLTQAEAVLQVEMDDLLVLDRALDQLNEVDERLRYVVELRFFAGVPEQDIARMLGVSARTVERDWLKARLFLLQAIEPAA